MSILGTVLVRRLLIALAVLLALTAVAAGVDTPRTDTTPEPRPPAVEGGSTVEKTLEADAPEPTTIRATLGDTVVLTVNGSEPDSVFVDGIGKMEALDLDSPARIEFYADTAGAYPITMLQSERRIGTLEIG